MNREWNLDILYKGYEDPAFLDDLSKLECICEDMNQLTNEIVNVEDKVSLRIVNQICDLWEAKIQLEECLIVYCSLRQSTDTSNAQSASYLSQISQKTSDCAKAESIFKKYLSKIENVEEFVAGDKRLVSYTYLLNKIKKESKHLLGDEAEEVIAKLDITGSMAWENLHSYLTSSVKGEYCGEEKTLTQLRNLAYDKDVNVRKAAYEAELACYDKIKDSICFSLNSIKGQVSALCKMRGYESPLAMTLEQSHMKKETLDTMWKVIEEYLPVFHSYLRKKAELLGEWNGLSWYNLFAPVGESERKFSAEEAKVYLVNHFSGFSKELADMVEKAFDEEWIDFYPHSGKVGGAFCCNIQSKQQSRVLTNFNGTLSDVVTLAHELGHAFHNENIHNHRILNLDYSMPVAETASTFNENVILNAAISEASEDERFTLIEGQLQDLTQIICDIYSRYLFETKVFEQCKEQFMFSDELNEIMLQAQKKAYGNGLNSEALHPYMWVCKGHYYSGNISFYNFPYAFGGLFARGLYAMYLKEGESFLPKYKSLLHATTVCDVEEVASYAGIDLTRPEFWKDALEQVKNQIEEFIRLCDKKLHL